MVDVLSANSLSVSLLQHLREDVVMNSDLLAGMGLEFWQRATLELVRRPTPDLSARQMAILLTVYLEDSPHTVRGLAALLGVSKPAVTRAVDRLCELGLVERISDARDRRSVLVQRTSKGESYLDEFGTIIRRVVAEIERDTGSVQ